MKYNLVGGQNGPADDVREVIHPNTQAEHDVDSTTIPIKEGYTFEAWYDDPEGGNLVAGKRVVGVNDHAGDQEDTLYAH
ncbi:MAG: InlB B-repeat-containing protein [Clostridia bacterium]|nr:InlB B-repeat-containing protein [Clostridia bacterium]